MCSVDGQQRCANTGYPARRPAKMASLATTICRDQDQLFYKIHFTHDIMSALQSGYNSLTSPVSACTKASMRANPSKPKAFATISILFLHDVIAASLVCPPNNQDCQFCISWWGAKAAPGRVGGRETRQILLDKWWRWRSQIHPCPTCQCSTTKSTELPPLRHNSSSSQKLHHYFKRVKCNLNWQCTKLKLKLWELAFSIC